MKKLFKKIFTKKIILYFVFGVMTTVVNLGVFEVMKRLTGSVHARNIVAWVAAVSFAYVTNKLFVFESKSWAPKLVGREVVSFFGARLVTLGIEELGLFICINLCHFDRFQLPVSSIFIVGNLLNKLGLHTDFAIGGDLLTKGGLAVIVLVTNYLFSQFIIFRKKKDKPTEDTLTEPTEEEQP